MARSSSLSLSRFTCLAFGVALGACSGEGDTTTIVAACGPGTEIVGQTCVIPDAIGGSGGSEQNETGGDTSTGAQNTGGSEDGAGGSTGGVTETGGSVGTTGGDNGTGGVAQTGGSVGVTGGASTGGSGTGGEWSGTGAVTSTGGVDNTGGIANTGGTGGVTSTGGVSGTGGTAPVSGWFVYTKSSVVYAVDVTEFPLQAAYNMGGGGNLENPWSPDGRYLVRCYDGCVLHDMSGEEPGPATPVSSIECYAGGPNVAWSPDGKSLVTFRSNVAAVDPTQTLPIRHLIGGCATNIGFSPVDNVLAYGENNTLKLVEVTDGVPGVAQTIGTFDPQYYSLPSWSPVGGQVVFRDLNGALQVATVGSGTSGPVKNIVDDVSHWAFSPDGTRIAYTVTDDANFKDHTFITKVSDGSWTTVEVPSTGYYGVPMWSPDSRYIVWPQGSGPQLVDTESASPTFTTLAGLSELTWAPDSKKLAAYDSLLDQAVVFAPASPGVMHIVATGVTTEPDLAFSPDGAALAVGEEFQIVVNVATLPPSSLVSTLSANNYGTNGALWSDSGGYLAFSPRQTFSYSSLSFVTASGANTSAPVSVAPMQTNLSGGFWFQPGL